MKNMSTHIRWSIRLLLVSSFILHPSSFSSVRADGGTVRLSQRQGDYRITVFTEPTPLRAGPVDVSVLVQDGSTGQLVTDARVTIRAALRGRASEAVHHPATSEAATNKLFRAAAFELPEAGWWEIEIGIDGRFGPSDVRFDVEVAQAAPVWLALWPFLGWPALVILLFGVHQWLVRRKQRPSALSRVLLLLPLAVLASAGPASAKTTTLTDRLHHLRVTEQREWSDFPVKPEGPSLSLTFRAESNVGEWTLRMRQQDVKQTWRVLLNGKELARLPPDENDMVTYLPVPAGRLLAGENRLVIEQVGRVPDDIRVGEIMLDDRPVSKVLKEASVEVSVQEIGLPGAAVPTPARITILNHHGALMTVGAVSGAGLAVRPGVVYTATGTARFGLPAGEYIIHAGRGFAYGIDTVRPSLRAGDRMRRTLSIRREVPIKDHVSCDTHVHTLTYSGHGDSTLNERMITIAGEGIDLPIATDHNRQIDYSAAAVKQGVRHYFTPVVGNEVTSAVGHFNIFPVKAGGPVPEFAGRNWKTVFAAIARAEPKVIVLNHPRDRHSGFQPFSPEHHLSLTGTNLDGWELKANAMEVINSGALQSDFMRPYHDWFGLLNRGKMLTPVGASDSHDVSRFFVGQARTYIRCASASPGRINLDEAVNNLLKGQVMVSCGLLAEITVNDKYGPGDLVPVTGEVKVSVRVLGPSWTTAERVELYANGHKVREARITDGKRQGVKWSGVWELPRPRHDVHLVAIASGPGVTELYWPIAKPYQPTAPVVHRRVIGSTGAVWLDSDGDGKRTCARDHAERLYRDSAGKREKLVQALADCDEAVAAQAADLLRERGVRVDDPALREAARKAGPHVERAFEQYRLAWRESQAVRELGR
jgi:hypothetical protein